MPKGMQVQVVMPPKRGGPAAVVTDAPPQPETAGVKRVAKMYSRWAGWCGWVAGVLGAISVVFVVDMASDLGTTWPQVVKLSLLAGAGAVGMTLVTIGAAAFEASHPARSAALMRGWRIMVFISSAAVLFFVANMGTAATTPQATARIAELRGRLAAPLAPTEWEAWRATQSCEAPSGRWRETCEEIKTRRAGQWAEIERLEGRPGEWSPSALIGTGALGAKSEIVRRLLAGALAIGGLWGAGMMARLSAQVYDEANMRADGLGVQPAAAEAPAPSRSTQSTPSIASVELWFRARVHHDVNGRLSPSDAYADYRRCIMEQGMPPVPEQTFFNWLASKAAALGIEKGKRSSVFYAGLCLAGEVDMGELMSADEPALLPYD